MDGLVGSTFAVKGTMKLISNIGIQILESNKLIGKV